MARPTKAGSAPPSRSKGFALEEALRLHFAQNGFFALRSLPFRLEGDDVTDIDIWLYEQPATIARRRAIVDVKNKKSPQAAERLIWTKGLQAALGVEAAFVATTDKRPATQRLARSLRVGLIEHVAFDQLIAAFNEQTELMGQDEFELQIRMADEARHETLWRDAVHSIKTSLLTGLGFASANRSLNILRPIYQNVLLAPAGSDRAIAGSRLIYFSAACAAISLDYAMAEFGFQSRDERRKIAQEGLRFGNAENSALSKIKAASNLIESYIDNGKQIARLVEAAFMEDANSIPVEIISEHVSRTSQTESLFNPAKILLDAALSKQPRPYDTLEIGAKSLLGVFIDFVGGSRGDFANLLPAKPANHALLL